MISQPVVLDVWQHIEPRFGGVGPAAASLAAATEAVSEWTFRQVAYCDPDEFLKSDGINAGVEILKVPGRRPIVDRKLRVALEAAIRGCSLCHVHGIWQPHSLAVQSLGESLKKPVIASAHGMLERWELSHKALRKEVYSRLFERPALSHSFCLRALSDEEGRDYRRYGLTAPIAVIPNGVLPLRRSDPATFLSHYRELQGKLVVLYLSRIHEKKGILNLLSAWKQVVASIGNAHLLVAGPEYPAAAKKAREIIRVSQIETSVTLCGTIRGDEKLAALSLARCFCLPSYSEGQSIAVLEALSIGLPVVVTPACNVRGIAEARAGHVTSNHPELLAQSIIDLLSLSNERWHDSSSAAERLARTTFGWSTIAQNMFAVYKWMLGAPKPEFVSTI